MGHFIFSGLHAVGQFLTPSIKGFFPSFRGENSIGKLLKSTLLYYGLFGVVGTVALIGLTVLAFKLSPIAFVSILAVEAGLALYAGYTLYKACCTTPNLPQRTEEQHEIDESSKVMGRMLKGKTPVEENSCFTGTASKLFAKNEVENEEVDRAFTTIAGPSA